METLENHFLGVAGIEPFNINSMNPTLIQKKNFLHKLNLLSLKFLKSS
jgi:hypothetical protein